MPIINLQVKFAKITRGMTQTKFEFIASDNIPNEIDQLVKMPGYLMFQEDEFAKEKIEAIKDKKFVIEEDGLTPSQKLRDTLLEIWYKRFSHQDKETFYKEAMAGLRQNLKIKYGV